MVTPRTQQHAGVSMLASWQTGLADVATEKPSLAREVARHRNRILFRFAHFHAKLEALPRRTRRALERRLSMTLAGVALMLALGSGPAAAAIIDVDGIKCTLIDAIIAANTDTAIGGCPGGSGADTLVLRPGSTHTLDSVYTEFFGPTGLPVITSKIRIEGNGASIRRQATAPAFRILAVSSASLTLHGMTITGGSIVDSPGGGIYALDSTVDITKSTVSGNTVGGETSFSDGGGLHAADSTVTITESTFSGNSAHGSGGGIRTSSSRATITNSTVSGNTAGSDGGGVALRYGSATIANSTLSGNTARGSGGGVAAGVQVDRQYLAFDRSIVAGNTANDNSQVDADRTITVIANNYNLFGTDGDAGVAGFTPGATDIVPSEGVPLSAIVDSNLADNGGPTLTHALVSGSPAIDAVPASADCGGTDQRGESRRQDGNGDGVPACDIGAYEFGGVPPGDVGVPGPRPSKAMPWIPLLLLED
ncbi:MAG: choice-of-anchor Q domain-containing protein [Gammaproteobacteria bacterium]|nr:choice-of-anchor Q domain-containing protein [Gammaproteobacteria bacterium]